MKKKLFKRSRSALNIKNPKFSHPIKYALTPDQIYQIDSNQLDFGVRDTSFLEVITTIIK